MTDAVGGVDLHVHTTASDGTVDVETRVEQASERDLEAIAITDHDCIAPALEEPVVELGEVSLVSGTEVRADLFDTKVEFLGYFVEPDARSLMDVLERARAHRQERNRQLVENLRNETPFDVPYEELRASVDGNLGRPHLAKALVEAGVARSIGDAFDSFLGSDGVAYVPMERVRYTEVLEAIHDAGGVAALAHPGRIRSDRVPEMVATLVDAGLDALEVVYPYDEAPSTDYADVDVDDARRIAREHDLVATGGSDCHGPGSGKFRLGEPRVDRTVLERLHEAAEVGDRP